MRLIEEIIILFFSMILFSSFLTAQRTITDLSVKAIEAHDKAASVKFISESFRNCAQNKGFCDFNEWQIQCRKLWKLDYIAWCNAEDFMEVSYVNNPDQLFYGTWTSKYGTYEVYCRSKNE